MTKLKKLIDDGATRILLAETYEHDGTYTEENLAWARRALGIGEELEHCGDCTNVPITCTLCVREEYQRKMRAAMAAINASGIAWVAPWDPDDNWDFRFYDDWTSVRDTYLAEEKERNK